MINALHLLWIIPLSGCIGFVVAALCVASSQPYAVHTGKIVLHSVGDGE